MRKIRLDDLHVDSFATADARQDLTDTSISIAVYPYSLLGSCYGCPTVGDATITVCPPTYAAAE